MRTFCNRNTFYNRYRHKKVRIFGKFAFILKCERSHFEISLNVKNRISLLSYRGIPIFQNRPTGIHKENRRLLGADCLKFVNYHKDSVTRHKKTSIL